MSWFKRKTRQRRVRTSFFCCGHGHVSDRCRVELMHVALDGVSQGHGTKVNRCSWMNHHAAVADWCQAPVFEFTGKADEMLASLRLGGLPALQAYVGELMRVAVLAGGASPENPLVNFTPVSYPAPNNQLAPDTVKHRPRRLTFQAYERRYQRGPWSTGYVDWDDLPPSWRVVA